MLKTPDNLTPTSFSLMLKEQLVASLTVYRDLDILINELKGDEMAMHAPKSVYRELQKSGRSIGLSLLYTRGLIKELEKADFWQGSADQPDPVLPLLDLLSLNLTLLLTLEDYQSAQDLPWQSWNDVQKMFADTNIQNWLRKNRPS